MKKNKVNVIGFGGHSKVVEDVLINNGYKEINYYDDKFSQIKYKNKNFYQNTILKFIQSANKEIDVFIAIGDNKIRKKIFTKLVKYYDYNFPTLIDKNSIVSKFAQIDKGSVVMPGVVINHSAKIGSQSIINTKASLDHENEIGNFVHIGPGSCLAGKVIVKDSCFLGTGTIVINNIKIEKNTHTFAGTIVTKDLKGNRSYFFKKGELSFKI